MADATPSVPYWHLYVDADGVSHHRRCALSSFELKGVSPGTAPQWNGRKTTGTVSVSTVVMPVGWVGQWHENPRPQWIVPLSGRWFVEAMDGQRVEMGAGEISFGEDQGTRERDGRKGHLSGTVGGEPAVAMIIQFEDDVGAPLPCRFD